MNYTKLLILFLLALFHIFYSQSAFPDTDKLQTQPDADINKLVEKHLNDVDRYVNDYDDNEIDEELLEDNFYKARWKLIKLGKKAVPQLVSKLKSIRVYRWNYEEDNSKRGEYEELLFELLPEILGKIGTPVHPYVLEMLKDEDLYIRKYAINILHHNREVPLSMLDPILQSASYDYIKLLKKIAETYDSEYVADEYYFGDLEEYYIGELDWTIMRIYDAKPKDFIKTLNDGDDYVRFAALFVLNNEAQFSHFDKETISAIRSLASHKNAFIRKYAIEILSEFSDPKDIPLFLHELSNEITDYSAFCSLYSYNPELVVDEMIKLINSKNESSKFSFSNKYVVEYFTEKANPKAVPYLIPLLQNINVSNEYLLMVSDAIVNCADETNIPKLLKFLDLNDKLSQSTAIKALSKIGVESIKDRVLKLKNDENTNIREAVLTWLIKFPAKDQLEYLLKSLKDKSEKIRAQAVLVLTNFNDEKVKSALLNAIKDKSVIVKQNVCIAANKLNAHEFANTIEKLLLSDDIDIYYYDELYHIIIDTLIRFKQTDVFPTLGKVFADHSCYYEDEDFIKEKIKEVFMTTKFDKAKVIEGMYEVLRVVSVSDHEAKTQFILELLKNDKSVKFLKALNRSLLTSSNDSAVLILNKISKFSDKSSLEFLLKFSETANFNEEDELRSLLAGTIQKIADKSDIPMLLEVLKTGNTRIKDELMEVICKLGGKEYLASILDLLNSKLPWVRIVAVNGYSMLADNPIPKLQELFKNNDNFMIKLYIAGNIVKYAKFEATDYEEYILKFLSDEDYKDDVVEMVGYLKIKSFTPHLLNLLKTYESFFFEEVVDALGFEGNTAAVPTLCNMLLNYHYGNVRCKIASQLSVIGDKTAIPSLIKSMKTDIDLSVRATAAYVLGKFGDTSAVLALIEALDDKDGAVARVAR